MSILDRLTNMFGAKNEDDAGQPVEPMMPPAEEPEAPVISPQEPGLPMDTPVEMPMPGEEKKEDGLGI
jgi:hypothetical protein